MELREDYPARKSKAIVSLGIAYRLGWIFPFLGRISSMSLLSCSC
jgi:hypothetical protein